MTFRADEFTEMTVRFTLADAGRALDCSCDLVAAKELYLNRVELFPTGSELNVYEVVNFRNRHFTPSTWPELLTGRELETSTYSDDWQFAPHPTAFLLRKNESGLFAGFLELQPAFGVRLKVCRGKVVHWDLHYGDGENAYKLQAGTRLNIGRIRLFVRSEEDPYAWYGEFGRMLVEEGSIPDPAEKKRYDWWREPIYCTWNDQRMLAQCKGETELALQTVDILHPVLEQLNEAMLWQAIDVIQREHLPVRTILLDEGWNVARGDWRPHPERFPDFRGTVDRLHAMGFRVMVWWSWAEIATDAAVATGELANGGWVNRHGKRWRDYSEPHVREAYLKPLMRKLFCSEPDCYDLDGVKTDFLADKVNEENPLCDPEWRGEERYFQRMFECFYREMRRHKPDAMHLGCAGNYWLSPYIDMNRTYDVHSSNWREHEERARMLEATCPGVLVSYDMPEYTETLKEYFESAHDRRASIEIGNVLICQDHFFAHARPADASHWAMLREGCAMSRIGIEEDNESL
jgi:hypothetical protein